MIQRYASGALTNIATHGLEVTQLSEEGLAACYAGFQAKALRMGLAGLVGLSSFDAAQWLLSKAPT